VGAKTVVKNIRKKKHKKRSAPEKKGVDKGKCSLIRVWGGKWGQNGAYNGKTPVEQNNLQNGDASKNKRRYRDVPEC